MPQSIKKKITNAAKAKAQSKVRATLTPARIKMAKDTLRNVRAAVPKKQRKAAGKLVPPKVKAGAKKLMSIAKKMLK